MEIEQERPTKRSKVETQDFNSQLTSNSSGEVATNQPLLENPINSQGSGDTKENPSKLGEQTATTSAHPVNINCKSITFYRKVIQRKIKHS